MLARLTPEFTAAPPSPDDLLALADAVREVGRRTAPEPVSLPEAVGAVLNEAPRRGHLRVLRGEG